ncbi:hypothetical protein D3C72_1792280 [compost metagenome]
MTAPSRTRARPAASTATCPPVASVMEPFLKSTPPALLISTSDWSRRYLSPERMLPVPFTTGATRLSRWLSRAVALSSSQIAVVAPSAKVTLAFSPAAFRCTEPRLFTDVLASATPACVTSRPASVTSPMAAVIRPVLLTAPAVLPTTNCVVNSLPRVVDCWLPSDPWPRLITKLSPAASAVCPDGVEMAPALCTSLPTSRT